MTQIHLIKMMQHSVGGGKIFRERETSNSVGRRVVTREERSNKGKDVRIDNVKV